MIPGSLRAWLTEPRLGTLHPDSAQFSLAHRNVLLSKSMLRDLFEHFYRRCMEADVGYFGACPGARVELGSGAGFFRDIYPQVITSDVKLLPFVDLVFRAEHMPFQDATVRAVYAINAFHHLTDPRDFFRELLRVLHPGGGAILIEPYFGALARKVFRSLHATETFDPDEPSWERSATEGPFSGANQALSYIVFKRDRARFEAEFPGLALVADKPHTHLRYVASGGLNFRQLAPDVVAPVIKAAEKMLSPVDRWLALQHTVILRKR